MNDNRLEENNLERSSYIQYSTNTHHSKKISMPPSEKADNSVSYVK